MKLNSTVLKRIWSYSKLVQTHVTMNEMCYFSSQKNQNNLLVLTNGSQFLIREFKIRFSHRIKELDALPYGLNQQKDIIKVRNWYIKSFQDLCDFETHSIAYKELKRVTQLLPKSPEKITLEENNKYYNPTEELIEEGRKNSLINFNRSLLNLFYKLRERHQTTVINVAKGLLKWKTNDLIINSNNIYNDKNIFLIKKHLDNFYFHRIGIKILLDHHISLLETEFSKEAIVNNMYDYNDEKYVGIVCTNTDIPKLAKQAIENAQYIVKHHYDLLETPPVELILVNNTNKVPFVYIPAHLIHVLFEILKNALRAIVEFKLSKEPNNKYIEFDIPNETVKVIISYGKEDIVLKICDKGGGIPRSMLKYITTYLYTTMPQSVQENLLLKPPNNEINEESLSVNTPMAGLGYGLALSTLYAKYFGGNLKVMSVEGYGTDVYLYLKRH
ncbi:related to dehydrogenase kinase [Saccharomycodes ludwigii]|uniref:Protein-serine/threonine kinase n=1 Tax=Saccharomycodes ludwigii TaxID=36035 RepID=A0A376B7G3_9ASCO|nr:hypothetical protein SCDLUD_003746 [Saccharomycodes ludwigii]KAH3900741.1 hypothetical protein SCDLUD_003746 [Saccharomycodes ludwigii]SSD60592.1 related to dehydrogenase kinase [Saccharomycodes ludwigii]